MPAKPLPLTFSTLSAPTWTLPEILEHAATNGYRGVDFRGIGDEIDITKLREFTTELDATLASFRALNISMPCLNTSVTLVSPATQRWQEMLDEAHRYAQLARRTETKLIRIFGGAVPTDIMRDEAIAMARRHIRQLIKICKPAGCRPVLETHDAWIRVDEIGELLRDFQPDEIGILWDIEHTHRAGESPQETIDGLKRFIQHVHFKDSSRVDGKNVPKLMGEGDLPLKACVAALRSMGYEGFISLETEKRWHAGAPDAEASVPQFANFMRALFLDESSTAGTH